MQQVQARLTECTAGYFIPALQRISMQAALIFAAEASGRYPAFPLV
jgi:hypothetical protein